VQTFTSAVGLFLLDPLGWSPLPLLPCAGAPHACHLPLHSLLTLNCHPPTSSPLNINPLQVTGKEDKMVALKEVLEPYGERAWPSLAVRLKALPGFCLAAQGHRVLHLQLRAAKVFM